MAENQEQIILSASAKKLYVEAKSCYRKYYLGYQEQFFLDENDDENYSETYDESMRENFVAVISEFVSTAANEGMDVDSILAALQKSFPYAKSAIYEAYASSVPDLIYLFVNSLGHYLKVYENHIVISKRPKSSLGKVSAVLGMPGGLSSFSAGEKMIPISSITSVQMKVGGRIVGYLQFSILGGNEQNSRSGLLGNLAGATADENSMRIDEVEQNVIAKKIKSYIEEKLLERSMPQAAAVVQQVSVADELLKFKQLFDAGVLTREEFDAKKKQLLGN